AAVVITVAEHAPTASGGPDLGAMPGDTVTLDGSGSSDPDHMALTYLWTLAARPAGSSAALSSATAKAPTFVPDKYGTYVVILVVSDGVARSAPATVVVQVGATGPLNCAPAAPPLAAPGADQSFNNGYYAQLDGSA